MYRYIQNIIVLMQTRFDKSSHRTLVVYGHEMSVQINFLGKHLAAFGAFKTRRYTALVFQMPVHSGPMVIRTPAISRAHIFQWTRN